MDSSIAYYDRVAAEYNFHMTASDEAARQIVQKIFVEKVKHGPVLDFGGGTGLDLPWLLNHGYTVFFLEPSPNMRALAEKARSGSAKKPVFLEDQIDFHLWSDQHLPFAEKMQGILANFAVLNCIPDIESLFVKLSLICSSGTIFLATVLNTKPKKLLRTHSLPVAVKSLLNRKLISSNEFKGVYQETFLHTIGAYKSACRKQFRFLSFYPIPHSDFGILTLEKK